MNHENPQANGKEVISFSRLLALAHQAGLKRIKSQLVQAPNDTNGQLCIHHTEIELDQGVFDGTGDASPNTVNPEVTHHFIRVSESRALARAIRFGLNISSVCNVELGGEQNPPIPVSAPVGEADNLEAIPIHPLLTPKQKKALFAIAKSLKWSNDKLTIFVREDSGCTIDQLTKGQASALIEQLKAIQSGELIA